MSTLRTVGPNYRADQNAKHEVSRSFLLGQRKDSTTQEFQCIILKGVNGNEKKYYPRRNVFF